MSEQLTFESRILDGDILAIVLKESHDATTSSQFENAIQEHLDDGRTKIIIDCRHLGYISSLGTGSLVTLQARLRRKGGSVKLAALQGERSAAIRHHLYLQLLDAIATHRVADRPDRYEPRLRKRRPKHYGFLRNPRNSAPKRNANWQNAFGRTTCHS